MKIAKLCFVAIAYELHLDDGKLVDSSTVDDPLTFTYGAGQIIPGLEKALAGLSEGDQTEVVVEPAEGYGVHEDRLLQRLPRKVFPDDIELEVGQTLSAETPHGQALFTVTDIGDADVGVDMNHPLAGKRLNFKVTIVSVRELTDEEKRVIELYKEQRAQAASCHGDGGHSCGGCHGSCGGDERDEG